jgi:hypothetical protein
MNDRSAVQNQQPEIELFIVITGGGTAKKPLQSDVLADYAAHHLQRTTAPRAIHYLLGMDDPAAFLRGSGDAGAPKRVRWII